MTAKRKKVRCPTCGLDMNAAANSKPNPCPQCGQGRGPAKRKKGIVLNWWIYRHTIGEMGGLAMTKAQANKSAKKTPIHYESPIMRSLYKAGLSPLKPGESGKVRIIVEEP